ncbi:MAG: hypothetical protein AB7G62_00175 [Magnetospirillum sp.]
MLSELALSALTDVVLASVQAFAAGMLYGKGFSPGSAARWWGLTMMVIAATFLVGAIDHGFFEPAEHPWHQKLMFVNRALVAVAAFLIAATAALQFLGPRGRKLVIALAAPLAAIVVVLVFVSDNFFIVIAGYSAAMVLMLVLNLMHLRDGRGSWAMVAGIAVTFAASALPFIGGAGFAGIGIYAAYHIAMMPAVVAFYAAGMALDRRPVAFFSQGA